MVLVDTNVLIDIWEDDPQWADWSIAQLRAQSQLHKLAINSIVYAELAHAFHRYEDLDAAVEQLELSVLETPRAALFLAGKAFAQYKKSGGTRTNVLRDFLIGAHAAVLGCAIVTRNARTYTKYFPTVKIIAP